MSCFICGCCCRHSRDENGTGDAESVCAQSAGHIKLSVQAPANGLREELDSLRQRKENEKLSQQQKRHDSSEQHRHRMDDMKSGHDTEMSALQQSNRANTAACDSAMAKMNAMNQCKMKRKKDDHSAAMAAMRQKNDGEEVKRNEQVNVVKLANAQRVRNLGQRFDAQCSDVVQKQYASDQAHSQRMKVMSFSHCGLESSARNRNAADLKAQRHESEAKRQKQQNKVDAANERHQRNIGDENGRHGQEMRGLKSSSDARTATHESKMGRMKNKNQHKSDDANHMALHFVSLESRLKQSEARCTEHQQALSDIAKTVSKTQRRRDLLVSQSQVIAEVKNTVAKEGAESAEQTAIINHTKFGSDREEKEAELRFLRNQIQTALNSNRAFDEEMVTFLRELRALNEQIPND